MRRKYNSWWEITTLDCKWWFYYFREDCITGNWIDVEKYNEIGIQVPFHFGSCSRQLVHHKDEALYIWNQLPDVFVLQHWFYHKGRRCYKEYHKN